MSHRWMKFWPQDWQSDPGLRSCSLAARGLWIECIALMHRAEPYGHLMVNGIVPTSKRLAGIVGASERDVARLLLELDEAGVFSVNENGVIFSRRMVRDGNASQEGRDAVAKRWGKKGGGEEPNGGGDDTGNTPPNRGPNTPPNSLEAESETERDTSLRSVSPARAARSTPSEPKGFNEFWAAYPAKVGKVAARKAFPRAVQVAGGNPDEIVFGLKARLHLFPSDPQFIPNPATWLNQGRWEDDPDALFARQQGRA
jgi:hypothetical protein